MFNRILSKIKKVWNTPLKPLSFQIAKWYDDTTGESGTALVHSRLMSVDPETGRNRYMTNIKELDKGWIFVL